jgi:hypothetical protein
MKTSFALLCVLAFALPSNAQKAIDGKWESHFTGAQNVPIRVVFKLEVRQRHDRRNSHKLARFRAAAPSPDPKRKDPGNTVTFGIPYMVPFLYNRFGWRELATRVRNWGSPINSITGTLNDENISFSQHDRAGQRNSRLGK